MYEHFHAGKERIIEAILRREVGGEGDDFPASHALRKELERLDMNTLRKRRNQLGD